MLGEFLTFALISGVYQGLSTYQISDSTKGCVQPDMHIKTISSQIELYTVYGG